MGGGGRTTSRPDAVDVHGASSASFSFADPLQFQDSDDSSDKGDKEYPSLGKFCLSPAFREVVSLITGFFSATKPADSASVNLSPWLDNFGTEHRHDPRVFLALFDKLAPVKQDIDEKFQKAGDEKKKATNALPTLGLCVSLGGLKRVL